MMIPSFTAEAALYHGRGLYRTSHRLWPAAERTQTLAPQGFGCPDSDACDRHCRNDLGRKGGYCGGFLWHTCYCVDH